MKKKRGVAPNDRQNQELNVNFFFRESGKKKSGNGRKFRENARPRDQVHELLHPTGSPDPEGGPLRPEREGLEPGTVFLRREEVPGLSGRLQRLSDCSR